MLAKELSMGEFCEINAMKASANKNAILAFAFQTPQYFAYDRLQKKIWLRKFIQSA